VISAAWFAILFRFLPDVRPAWRTVFAGALFSAILFALGRAILYITLVKSNMSTLYGASASVVVLLLFVFYSSLILYYGAAVTVAWSETFRQQVELLPGAEFYTIREEPGKNIAS
jgi:membrane protein